MASDSRSDSRTGEGPAPKPAKRAKQAAAPWAAHLSDALGVPVEVSFGRARRHVLVARRESDRMTVRMNRCFAAAPDEVRADVAAWLRSGKRARRACERLDAWIETNAVDLPPARRTRIEPIGDTHDLTELSAGLLNTEFVRDLPPERTPGITWGRRGKSRGRRSLQLGSYDPEQKLVRIHRVLDQPAVPRFFVRSVLFHELLHAALDGQDDRRRHHGPEFRAREAAYPDHARAQEWQETHLRALMRSARSGKPMSARSRAREILRAIDPRQGWLFG